jgi:hypothetical protein
MDNNNQSISASSQKKIWETIISSFYESNPKESRPVYKIRPKCMICGVNLAIWENSILKDYCCDECVPRGCSCRLRKIKKNKSFFVDNYTYTLGEDGQELPCEDWHKF